MKLLIITQKVDRQDPVLGFFHRWVEEFSLNFEKVTVICLEKGESALPSNVKALSLGKEEGASRLEYLTRFYQYVWQERSNYDAVFVHMNQEYVLLAGDLWRLMGKKVFLWRNHAKGGLLTHMAVWIAHKVFYTSPRSFTARFSKAVAMPVGIDTEFFKPDLSVSRTPSSVLFLGRISPVKRVLEFIEWLRNERPESEVTIAGSALEKDKDYEKEVRKTASNKVKFVGAVDQTGALALYRSHETYVNKTSAGSFDKTIFEAAACEMKLILDNEDLKFMEGMSVAELRKFVVLNHSLKLLMDKLVKEII